MLPLLAWRGNDRPRGVAPHVAHDVLIRGVVPFTADDDAKTLRETCSGLRDGVDATYVYRDRRYRVTGMLRGKTVRVAHAAILNEYELWYTDRSKLQTLVLYYERGTAYSTWFHHDDESYFGMGPFPILRELEIRGTYIEYDLTGERIPPPRVCVGSRFITPELRKVVVNARCADVLAVASRVRLDIRTYSAHLASPIGYELMHLTGKRYYRIDMASPVTHAVFFDGGAQRMWYNGAPVVVRHAAFSMYTIEDDDDPLFDYTCLRELTIFDTATLPTLDGREKYEEISLHMFPNLEQLNIAIAAPVVDIPEGCIVNRMTRDEARAARQRLTVTKLDE